MQTSTEKKIIMGVDPGTNILGYAFVQASQGKARLLDVGVINLQRIETHTAKLYHIFEGVNRLISLYSPTDMALEQPFYGKDAQAMLKLGRAQGTAMVAAVLRGVSVFEYAPMTIKKAVTGRGRATKEQVSAMLPHLVEGDIRVSYLDATDALAVALCHQTQQSGLNAGSKRYNDWKDLLKERGQI